MQTYLPYPDFERSARALDNRRLGKQRLEALALLRGKWRHHPAAKMWAGHRYQLGRFALAVCDEWRRRGFRDTVREQVLAELRGEQDTGLPPWFGDPRLHLGHQARLVRKDPGFYRMRFPDVPLEQPEHWPVPPHKDLTAH